LALAGVLGARATPSTAHGTEPTIQRPSWPQRTVTRSPAPGRPPEAGGAVESPASSSAPTLARDVEDPVDGPRTWKHSGFVLDAEAGLLGCLGGVCQGSGGHATQAGPRVGGFLGGNVGGVLEIGLQGAWGRVSPQPAADATVLDLYGIDPAGIQPALQAAADAGVPVDLSLLRVNEARMSSVQAGLGLRVHFVRRGRIDPWVGSGIGYELTRARYRTPLGDAELDFHGLGVPMQGGLQVFLTRHLAVGADFEYRWTRFAAGRVEVPGLEAAFAVSALEREGHGAEGLGDRLPRFWTAGVSARVLL
jgi:hypothetical protein